MAKTTVNAARAMAIPIERTIPRRTTLGISRARATKTPKPATRPPISITAPGGLRRKRRSLFRAATVMAAMAGM